jgi:hypothetical protein
MVKRTPLSPYSNTVLEALASDDVVIRYSVFLHKKKRTWVYGFIKRPAQAPLPSIDPNSVQPNLKITYVRRHKPVELPKIVDPEPIEVVNVIDYQRMAALETIQYNEDLPSIDVWASWLMTPVQVAVEPPEPQLPRVPWKQDDTFVQQVIQQAPITRRMGRAR